MDRKELIERLKAMLDELDNDFEQYQIKAEQAGQTVRHEWERRKLELKAKQAELKSQLETLRNESNSHWEEVKANAERTWESTKAGLKDIRDNLFK